MRLPSQLSHRLLRGGATALALRLLGAALGFLMYGALASAMTKGEFGTFGMLFSLATFLANVASCGRRVLALRFLPIYDHEGDERLRDALIREGVVLNLGAASLLSAITAPLLLLWGFRPSEAVGFCACLLLLSLAEYCAHVVRGLGGVALALLPKDVAIRAAVIAVALAGPSVSFSLDAASSLAVLSGLFLASAVIQVALVPGVTVRGVARAQPPEAEELSQWRRVSRPLWAANVCSGLMSSVSVFLVGMLLSPERSAELFIAIKAASIAQIPLIAGNIVIGPQLSRLFHQNDTPTVQKTSAAFSGLILLPVVAALLIYAVAGRAILEWFNEDLVGAYPLLLIVTTGMAFNAFSGPTGLMLMMSGNEKSNLVYTAASNVASLAALVVFTLLLGVVGAAVALVVQPLLFNVAAWRFCRARLGVDPSVLSLAFGLRRAV